MRIQNLFLTALLVVLCAALLRRSSLRGEDDPCAGDVFTYDPGEWYEPGLPVQYPEPPVPKDKPYNFDWVHGQYPLFGYPMRPITSVGLNDTLRILVSFTNWTDKDYSLSGKNVEQWFRPRVYRNGDDATVVPPLADSSQLGYRAREWQTNFHVIKDPGHIPAKTDGQYGLALDVWRLPVGHYTVLFFPTEKVPSDFVAFPGGGHYEYYHATSLADTVNAYEGCFWRLIEDSNFVGAKAWVDSILKVNPTSVPGWWVAGTRYVSVQDTANARAAFDKALNYLNTRADPAMPDSTKRTLNLTEQHYLEYCETELKCARWRLDH